MDDIRIDWVGLLAGVESAGGPAGIGVDVEEVVRWAPPNVDLHTLFSSEERSYCDSKACPAEVYAGHWCLKEATVKALARVALISTRQVEVAHHPDGQPRVMITARGLESVVDRIHVSISHTKHLAVAVAILSGRPPARRESAGPQMDADAVKRSVVLLGAPSADLVSTQLAIQACAARDDAGGRRP